MRRLPLLWQVEFEADQVDRIIGAQDPVHGESLGENTRSDKHSALRDAAEDLGKAIEVGGKTLDDRW